MSQTIKVNNGDWYANPAGRFTWATGREKCAQDVATGLLQRLSSELGYGSLLGNLEESGPTLGTPEHHKLRIHTEASDAVDRIQTMQDSDPYVTDDEKIDSFSVIVERASAAPLNYYYFVSVETEAGDDPLQAAYEIQLGHTRDPNLNIEELTRLASQT